MTVSDVWDHYFAARGVVSSRMHWALVAGSHGNQYLSPEASRRHFDDARNYAVTMDRRKAAWEVGTVESRIVQIGGELDAKSSAKFRDRFPEALDWLESQGCDEAEAVRRFRAALKIEQQHKFWRQKSSMNQRRAVSRTIVNTRKDAGVIQDQHRDGGTPGPGSGNTGGATGEPRTGGE